MPSFNPFLSVKGRNCLTLFEIRLENDFIVFRGNEHESAGQTLKGTVVLCLPSALKIEDIHLQLNGTLRLSWSDSKLTASGVTNQKTDRAFPLLEHQWPAFVGGRGKSHLLPAGNYEWPFEFTLPGDTTESVEGVPEASITYRLKASITRGKLACDLHTYKPLRIIRTLEPGSLEFLHAMSVENIWPNKIDYSILIPQKAVVFGTSIPMEMRFTPLLKGLEMGEVTARLVETREVSLTGTTGLVLREKKTEREVATWKFGISRQDCWHDMIEDTGQEGWTIEKRLSLPKKLRQCVQDLNHHGIKIRHKLKLTVALRNPDGHVSELRATLPVSIFISPNMPFDDEGNLVNQSADAVATESNPGTVAPPIYGEHVLDQLFEDIDMSGFQTPLIHSGGTTPYYWYSHSRIGSHENLAGLTASHAAAGSSPPAAAGAVTAAALSTRLANMSLDASRRNSSYFSLGGVSSAAASAATSRRHSTVLSRSSSREDSASSSGPSTGRTSPEATLAEDEETAELSKVPSYATAVRTPARSRAIFADGIVLPDYEAATSAPPSPAGSDASDPLSTIREVPTVRIALDRTPSAETTATTARQVRTARSRPASISSFLMLQRAESHERRRFSWVGARA